MLRKILIISIVTVLLSTVFVSIALAARGNNLGAVRAATAKFRKT